MDPRAASPVAAPEASAPLRVLLAEDDESFREVLGLLLRRWGYSVVEVPDGADALAVLRAPDPPRLAVLDWEMPNMTGPEVCRSVRASGDTETFLMIQTGRGADDDERHALGAGANVLLPKPCDLVTMRALLDAAARAPKVAGRRA